MVKVENITKHFGPIKAVNGISFEVGKGEVLGFLGPNGAGKSTTMKMITCFLSPTSGTANVSGFDVVKNPTEVRKEIGYLPESAPLYDEMTVDSFLKFVASVRGYSGSAIQKQVDQVYETCQLKKVRYQAISTLSKGFRQRVCFAQALLHDPPVLILDEPTDGLDPNQKQMVRDLIASMKDDKVIILSTHILEEVDAVCSRAIIISQGELKIDGTPLELRKKSEVHGAVVLTVSKDEGSKIKDKIQSINNVNRIEHLNSVPETKSRMRVYTNGDADLAMPIAQLLKDNQINAEEFRVEQGRLDEVFRNITQTV